MAVTVGKFRDEQIVADQKRRLHRTRGDVEGLEQEGADHERAHKCVDDDTNGLAQAAFSFCPGCHAHCFPVPGFPNSRRENSARWQNLFLTRQAARFCVEKMVLVLVGGASSWG